MNDELRNKLMVLFGNEIQGGCTEYFDGMLDKWIEYGDLDADEVRANEMAIAAMFDDHWFNCVVCGWTFPVDHQGEDTDGGEFCCKDCEND